MVLKMKYNNVVPAIFLRRPNRFLAHVLVNGIEEVVHVKNTGRCKELLVPGCTVYLARAENPARKTKYDLVSVEKLREGNPSLLVNMDSQAANDIAEEWLRSGAYFSSDCLLRREVRYGDSRFDFYLEDRGKKAFLEVKGVTLERDGVAAFPDAPTQRGVKHLKELVACRRDGYDAYLLFIIQMKEISSLIPNDGTHKAFGDALREANAAGVQILALDCNVTPDTVIADGFVPVHL